MAYTGVYSRSAKTVQTIQLNSPDIMFLLLKGGGTMVINPHIPPPVYDPGQRDSLGGFVNWKKGLDGELGRTISYSDSS